MVEGESLARDDSDVFTSIVPSPAGTGTHHTENFLAGGNGGSPRGYPADGDGIDATERKWRGCVDQQQDSGIINIVGDREVVLGQSLE